MSTFLKGAGIYIAFFLVLALTMAIGIFGFGWFQRSTADFRGKTSQIEKTRADGNYRIASYDSFFDSCANIQGKLQTLKQLRSQLKTATDKQWTQQTINGIQASLNSDIAQYNADAQKEDTKGHFRSSGLPYSIPLDAKDVQCAS